MAFSFSLATQETYAITFSIANPQSDGEKVTFDISISGLTSSSCPNTKCYLQAAFTKPGNNNYLGFTQNNNSDWYKYNGTPDASYIQSTFFSFEPTSGNWSGELTIKVDVEDSDYSGPGSYDIKAWRYTGNSTTNAGSSDNTISADLTSQAPTPIPTPSPTPTPTPNPTADSSVTSTPTPTPKPSVTKASASPTPKPSSTTNSASASASPQVLGLSDYMASADAGMLSSQAGGPSAYQNLPSKKVAGILIGSGIGLIIFALGFHLWYRKINKGKLLETKDPFEL